MAICTIEEEIPGPPKAIMQVARAKTSNVLAMEKIWHPTPMRRLDKTDAERGPHLSNTKPMIKEEHIATEEAHEKIRVVSRGVNPAPP